MLLIVTMATPASLLQSLATSPSSEDRDEVRYAHSVCTSPEFNSFGRGIYSIAADL